MSRLSLSRALSEGLLEEFIEQEEKHGASSVPKAEYEAALAAAIKPRRLEYRTSRSPSRDGSAET